MKQYIMCHSLFVEPLPCIVGEWGPWSATDDTGGSSRVRNVVRININGGPVCPELIENKKSM